jgi:hypothetical protein
VDLDGFHPLFHRLLRDVLCRYLCRERSALAGALELHRSGARPADGVPAHIRDRDKGVVEGGLDVRDSRGDVFALFTFFMSFVVPLVQLIAMMMILLIMR